MKRPKKSTVLISKKMVEFESYELQCPHCHTFLVGGYGRDILRIRCHHCKEPIDIEWPDP